MKFYKIQLHLIIGKFSMSSYIVYFLDFMFGYSERLVFEELIGTVGQLNLSRES